MSIGPLYLIVLLAFVMIVIAAITHSEWYQFSPQI